MENRSFLDHIHIPMTGMYDIERDLEEIGYEHDPGDGDNTNGWEVDFSYKFRKDGHPTIGVSGSVWQSGNTYRIYIDDYEEEAAEENIN